MSTTSVTTTGIATMAATASDKPSAFLTLPPEVRNLIYKFAFQQAKPMRLRSPAQRRLRPSRPAKDDARGLLDSCQMIRSEAITLYYSLNALVFRSTDHVFTFLADPQIHPLIKDSLTHIAVDFGDSNNADPILKDHISLVDVCVGTLPRLRALETRFYARTLDTCACSHFHTLALAFDGLDADMNAPPSPRSPRTPRSSPRHSPRNSISTGNSSPTGSPCSSSPPWECDAPASEPEAEPEPEPDTSAIQAEVLEQYCFTPSAAVAFASSKLKFSVAATSEDYPGVKHDKLICYNLRMSVDGIANALGPAKEAVKQRISRVGMLPRRLSEMYDTAADGGFHQRVRATIASCARIDVGVS